MLSLSDLSWLTNFQFCQRSTSGLNISGEFGRAARNPLIKKLVISPNKDAMAITAQVGEYHEHSARWRPLMDATMGSPSSAASADMLSPAKIAPFVVWLCTDAAREVNGCTFSVYGDRVSLLAEPRPKATIEHEGGWTLDELDRVTQGDLIAGLRNRWKLENHPQLQEFPQDRA